MRVSPPASPLAPGDLGSSRRPSGPTESQTCLPAAGPKFSTQILTKPSLVEKAGAASARPNTILPMSLMRLRSLDSATMFL